MGLVEKSSGFMSISYNVFSLCVKLLSVTVKLIFLHQDRMARALFYKTTVI
jgi:hypothetical protein